MTTSASNANSTGVEMPFFADSGGANLDNMQFPYFVVTFGADAIFGVVNNIGDVSASLSLNGIGNVVSGAPTASVSVSGGDGLSTVVLGKGDDHVALQGAFNTVVLGDGNDVVNAGAATGTVVLQGGEWHVTYQNLLSATFSAPSGVQGLLQMLSNPHDVGAFNSGTGNIGAFNGWGEGGATDGNNNIGVFDGNFNGGSGNGNNNIGAFDGNFNGLGNSSPSDGNNNGNNNIGVLDGNYNGDLNIGSNSGNGNGNSNTGTYSGNTNGDGAVAGVPGAANSITQLVGGFDTIVVGNGSDSITALAGVSTIVAGNGNDQILIGGTFNTVVAGNGVDSVVGTNVDHTSITLGDGGSTVTLTGAGYNVIKTGSGNDVITLSGVGNWVDAGAAITFNTIYGGAGQDTFVLAAPGSGFDKIFNFTTSNGDILNLQNVLAAVHWDGASSDLGNFLTTQFVNGDTVLETTGSPARPTTVVAELMNVNYSISWLEVHSSLFL